MKVIGYIRVSTDEQASHGHSLAAQESKLRAYAQLYELDLVEVLVDAGHSAKSMKRPGLQQALVALESGRAGGLLIAKLDRLTRSVRDLGLLLDTYFERRFSLMCVGEQLDTRTAAGRLVVNILGAVSQWEREAISERTKAALAHKRAQGHRLGAAPHEDPAALARMLELRGQGVSLRDIGLALTAEGFPTQKGGRWLPTTVKRMLDRAAEEPAHAGRPRRPITRKGECL